MRTRIEVSGSDGVAAALRRAGPAARQVALDVLGAACKQIVPIAQVLAPVEPGGRGGELRASIRAAKPTATRAGRVSAAVVAGGAPLKGSLSSEGHAYNVYAAIQEKGEQRERGGGAMRQLRHTSGESHFLEKAATRVAPTVPGRLLQELDRAL